MTLKQRLTYYLLLIGLCSILPYITTIVFILILGDRIEGMQKAVFPSLIFVHLIFGLVFIKKKPITKFLLSLSISTITTVLVLTAITNGYFIEIKSDIYGYWDLALNNLLVGIIIWESFFQIEKKMVTQKNGSS